MENSKPAYKGLVYLKVLDVRHWTDKTFSFHTERPKSFRFRSGEFAMIGLENGEKPLLRAYSIASPSWSEKLQFYSIKVDNGPLTSKLQHIKKGDFIILRPKSVGTLVIDALLPGKRLILFSTGTGIAPFTSLIRDPDVYEKFDEVILTQTCRYINELSFGKYILKKIEEDEILSEIINSKLKLITSITREKYIKEGRITEWLKSEKFKNETGEELNLEKDRVMICGSISMLNDHKTICQKIGMEEGSNSSPGHFVIEKAFVD